MNYMHNIRITSYNVCYTKLLRTSLVEEMLGLVGTEAAIDLVRAVAAEGAEEAIRKFTSMLFRGADLKFLFLSLVDILRDAAVWKFTEQDSLLFSYNFV